MASASADSSPGAPAPRRVLVVDDDLAFLHLSTLLLRELGATIDTAPGGAAALRMCAAGTYDCIVSDVTMPGMSGFDLVRALRAQGVEAPVILLTASPGPAAAQEAVAVGAFRFLVRPLRQRAYVEVVALALAAGPRAPPALDASFERALRGLWTAYQPIVHVGSGALFAYKALLRSKEPGLATPDLLFEAAARLGRGRELSRAALASAARAYTVRHPAPLLFASVGAAELDDDGGLGALAPLAPLAARVVLDVTDRAPGEVPGLAERLRALRDRGFRSALDARGDPGALELLAPDFVRLDPALVRDVERDPAKQRAIRAAQAVGERLDAPLVAGGVEREEESRCLVSLGCSLQQGYFFARPGPPFPAVENLAQASL